MVCFLRILILWFLTVSFQSAQAQLAQSLRVEIPANPDETESFDVIPLGERGLLATVQTGGLGDRTPPVYNFQRYDVHFKQIWQTTFKQDEKYKPVSTYQTGPYLYHLFQEYDSDQFQFLRLHLDDGVIETFEGKLIDQFTIHHFKVMDSQAYVGGYHHGRPVVMAFSFFDQSTKVLPGLYVNRMELSSLEVDEVHQEVSVLIHALKRHCQFSINTYNYDGKLLRTRAFDGATNSLISGKLVPVNERESLLVGNYSTNCTPYSQGIYVTRIHHGDSGSVSTDDPAHAIQYIAFSQLQNFFNYLRPRQQQKLLARALKKKEEGKEYKFHYRLLVHDLQPTPDGLMLVAEVYYPQYRGSTVSYGGLPRSMDRYEGFRYTHAFLCGFDKQGNLLWDNCFPIKELVSKELTEMVQVSHQGNRTILAYPNDGEIMTELIQGNKVLKETETVKLKLNAETDKVQFSAQENLMAWYDQHFLATGFQKIAPSHNFARQREVFYLHKLTYNDTPVDSKTTAPKNRKSDGSER